MPQVFKIGSYWVYFWANENKPLEPVHVHISKGKPTQNSTKVWLTKSGGCTLANNKSNIPSKDLSELLETITNNYFYIISEWKKHFADTEIKFYC